MSASDKKKLRNAEQTEKLTERQAAERKEAKKLKIYTATFIIVTAILLATAITVGVMQLIDNSGFHEKNSVAMTVGDTKINAKEMTYFYVDAVQTFYSTNADFVSYLLDSTVPLNQQMYSIAEGTTWADYFLSIAYSNAELVYTLCAAAEAEGYTISDSEKLELESTVSIVNLYAQMYGYPDSETYLKAIYGNLANEKDFYNYQERIALANSYRANYQASLNYDDAAIQAAQEDAFDNYSSFTFNSYYIAASRFLEGGTEDANGTKTYSDEEKAASIAAAEEAAKALCSEEIDSIEAFDAAIANLPINADITAQSVANKHTLYTSLDSAMASWLAQDHQEGDMGYVPFESTTAEGTTVNGYYVLYYISREDNNMQLPTVRHILVGSADVNNGNGTYTKADLLKYRGDAEQILQQWKDGEQTEDAFAALATELSIDEGSAANGGLYENIVPGQMVDAFNDWCFDKHLEGDTGIVETSFGYHVMYFCGLTENTYREQMIIEALTTEAMDNWFDELATRYPMTKGESTYLPMGMTLS